jgi:general secretion pathway protein I
LEIGTLKLNKLNSTGFTLIEVLVALAILGFVLSSALKIFSSNALVVATLEQKTMASFVAENILIQTFSFNDELNYATGTQSQGGSIYQWERSVLFEQDGKSAQINIEISSKGIEDIYQLTSYKVLQ